MGRNITAVHVLIVLLVVLLLFGAKRLPELAKSVGQSMKIFKREVKDLRDDDNTPASPTTPPAAVTPGGAPPVVPPAADPPHVTPVPVADPSEGTTPPKA